MIKEQIIICMALRNSEKTVKRSIESFIAQKNTTRQLVLLIGNDHSTDSSLEIVSSFLPNDNIVLLNMNYGNISSTRNFLINHIRTNFPHCVLIGRLDSDDVLYDDTAILKIESIYDEHRFDAIICGNKQMKDGKLLEFENKAKKDLLNNNYLLRRLSGMSNLEPTAELPSCNIIITRDIMIEYPDVKSAEDHWFTVQLLLAKTKYNIYIAENLLYSIYSVDGINTKLNREESSYRESRIKLFQFFSEQISGYAHD